MRPHFRTNWSWGSAPPLVKKLFFSEDFLQRGRARSLKRTTPLCAPNFVRYFKLIGGIVACATT